MRWCLLVIAFLGPAAALAQQPHIDNVLPSRGPIAGGTVVTIQESNFSSAAITLDRTPIAPLQQSDTELRLQMPAHANGHAIIAVKNAEGIRAIRFGAVLAPAGATLNASASGTTIRATVRDATGKSAEGVRVEFSVPSSGASCSLSSSFGVTNTNGETSVSCTPNCTEGTYRVNAQPVNDARAEAGVTFTNSTGPCRRRALRH